MPYQITFENKQYEFDSVLDCADILDLPYSLAWNLIFMKNRYIDVIIPSDKRPETPRGEYSPLRPNIVLQNNRVQKYSIIYLDGTKQTLHLCYDHLRHVSKMISVANTQPVYGTEKQTCQWCDKLKS